jgi:hypothetical protein
MLDKIKAWFKHSLTVLWARIVTLAGVVMAIFESLLQDPTINSAIQSALQPKYIPYWVIGIGVLTELARRRSLSK